MLEPVYSVFDVSIFLSPNETGDKNVQVDRVGRCVGFSGVVCKIVSARLDAMIYQDGLHRPPDAETCVLKYSP